MRKLIGALTALVLAAPAAQAAVPALPTRSQGADVVVFAAGGTQLSNGFFFPGTAIANNGEWIGVPLQVSQGSNLRFVNLDHFIVAGGSHQITSYKKVTVKHGKHGKYKRPLFYSKQVAGPGETTVKTSHLKPGIYDYYCPVHDGMNGLIEVK